MARPRLGESERRTRTIGVRVTEAEEAELRVLGVYSYSKDSSHSAMVSGSVATRSAHSRVSNQ